MRAWQCPRIPLPSCSDSSQRLSRCETDSLCRQLSMSNCHAQYLTVQQCTHEREKTSQSLRLLAFLSGEIMHGSFLHFSMYMLIGLFQLYVDKLCHVLSTEVVRRSHSSSSQIDNCALCIHKPMSQKWYCQRCMPDMDYNTIRVHHLTCAISNYSRL